MANVGIMGAGSWGTALALLPVKYDLDQIDGNHHQRPHRHIACKAHDYEKCRKADKHHGKRQCRDYQCT